jgi:hypothetical protein
MSELLSIESIGWIATIVVVASYFFTNPLTLRLVQIGGASLWLAYGVVIDSAPVIVANALVLSAASWSVLRQRYRQSSKISQRSRRRRCIWPRIQRCRSLT